MWHDHQLSQGNKATKRTVGVEVGGRKKIEKRQGVGNIGAGGLQLQSLLL